MAKIDLDCNFQDCPHNVECKCSIPGGVIIATSGRCMHASIVLDSRKTSDESGAVDNSTQHSNGAEPAEICPKCQGELIVSEWKCVGCGEFVGNP